MSIEIAKTILAQLGGKQFAFMTGAKDLTALENGLSFKLPGNLCRDRVNRCKILLMGNDTYTMIFSRLWGVELKEISKHDGLFFDQLTEVFRDATGLETRMPRILNLEG